MLFYLGISGGSLPALRSFVMISLFLAGLLLGRKGFWLHSLLFAAVLLVLWEPGVIMSLSFQLSFVAVLFIGFSLETPEQSAWRIQPYLAPADKKRKAKKIKITKKSIR
jgi:ComEC/Rec2-related protein